MSLREVFLYPTADNRSPKNYGVEEEAYRMFEMGEEMMKLPLKEKMKYEQGDNDGSFGLDISSDTKPQVESLRTRQDRKSRSSSSTSLRDDALAYPQVVQCTSPSTIRAASRHLVPSSLVFFTRPSYWVILRALIQVSTLIADAVHNTPGENFKKGQTAKEWFSRRAKYQRVNNRAVLETWKASRGTE
ncbi:hypothetical protein ARMSODRAFT_1022478 [Armillaria solidipes]|uniref:Uncharacterized protein n=1 Tax=Armillaria solidipes TaxID=1076256 RepID=A0A2H3B918_9AGAR|nr:hypothetical protein ARMSODRAFT_1022478 [Armillaria solidipes]